MGPNTLLYHQNIPFVTMVSEPACRHGPQGSKGHRFDPGYMQKGFPFRIWNRYSGLCDFPGDSSIVQSIDYRTRTFWSQVGRNVAFQGCNPIYGPQYATLSSKYPFCYNGFGAGRSSALWFFFPSVEWANHPVFHISLIKPYLSNNNNRRLVTLAEHTSDHGRQTNSSTEEKGEQV